MLVALQSIAQKISSDDDLKWSDLVIEIAPQVYISGCRWSPNWLNYYETNMFIINNKNYYIYASSPLQLFLKAGVLHTPCMPYIPQWKLQVKKCHKQRIW